MLQTGKLTAFTICELSRDMQHATDKINTL